MVIAKIIIYIIRLTNDSRLLATLGNSNNTPISNNPCTTLKISLAYKKLFLTLPSIQSTSHS